MRLRLATKIFPIAMRSKSSTKTTLNCNQEHHTRDTSVTYHASSVLALNTTVRLHCTASLTQASPASKNRWRPVGASRHRRPVGRTPVRSRKVKWAGSYPMTRVQKLRGPQGASYVPKLQYVQTTNCVSNVGGSSNLDSVELNGTTRQRDK